MRPSLTVSPCLWRISPYKLEGLVHAISVSEDMVDQRWALSVSWQMLGRTDQRALKPVALTHGMYELDGLHAVAGSLVFRGKLNGEITESVLDG